MFDGLAYIFIVCDSAVRAASPFQDSFCVGEDDEPSTLLHTDSLLERAEEQLERMKRKRSCSDKADGQIKRTKMNILNQSVSSEDEIEQLRVQVQED